MKKPSLELKRMASQLEQLQDRGVMPVVADDLHEKIHEARERILEVCGELQEAGL